MTQIENQLRAVLRADAQCIQAPAPRQIDLAPARPRRFRRFVSLTTIVAVAAATVAILAGPRLLTEFQTRRSAPAVSASPAGAVTAVTATTRTTTVSGARASIPVLAVHGANSRAAERARATLQQHVTNLVGIFQYKVRHTRSPPGAMSLRITVSDTTVWNHFLSVRFAIITELGRGRATSESSALVFDGAGRRINPFDLFTDRRRLTAAVRTALIGSRPGDSLGDTGLATLSLTPARPGRTASVAGYPTAAGLECFVNPGIVAPDALGTIEATVPWKQLTPLLRPGLH